MHENENVQSHPLPHSKKLKLMTTVAVLLGNITFGCAFNFFAPALEDFRKKYDTSVEDVSKIFTIFLVCYCIGALLCGYLYNHINRQIGVIVCLIGMAFGLYVAPFLPSKTLFFVVGGLIGFFGGCYECAQVVWIIEIWQSKSGPFIEAQHFFYALGSNIPPLLIGPFLSKDNSNDDTTPSTTTLAGETDKSKIYIPFTIAGALVTLACFHQIFLFTFFRYYKPPLEDELSENDKNENLENKNSEIYNINIEKSVTVEQSPTRETKESKPKFNWLKAKLITLTVIFLGAYSGMEICSMSFIPTFGQYSDLKMTESDAAFVLTGLTAAFAVGRFIGIFVILKVNPQWMLCGNVALVTVGNFIILIWANDNLTMWWVGCIVLGAGLSTTYATFCAYIEKHLLFTNGVGSACIVIGSGTAAIYPLIVGQAIDKNAVVLTYTNFFSICVCVFALAYAFKLTHGNKKRVM